jgi:hypothetical protein
VDVGGAGGFGLEADGDATAGKEEGLEAGAVELAAGGRGDDGIEGVDDGDGGGDVGGDSSGKSGVGGEVWRGFGGGLREGGGREREDEEGEAARELCGDHSVETERWAIG